MFNVKEKKFNPLEGSVFVANLDSVRLGVDKKSITGTVGEYFNSPSGYVDTVRLGTFGINGGCDMYLVTSKWGMSSVPEQLSEYDKKGHIVTRIYELDDLDSTPTLVTGVKDTNFLIVCTEKDTLNVIDVTDTLISLLQESVHFEFDEDKSLFIFGDSFMREDSVLG